MDFNPLLPNTAPQASALSLSGPKGQTNSFSFPVSDADNNPLTVSILQQGSNGTAYVTGNTNGYYVPFSSLPLVDFFTYYVSDGQGGFATNTVSVTLTNRQPVLTNLNLSGPKGVAVTNRVPASDPDDDSWTAFVAQPGTNGLASILNGTNFVYAPNTNAPVSDVFRLYVVDAYAGVSTTNTVGVSLTNRPPVGLPVTNSGVAGTPIAANLTTNVSDPDAGDTNLSVWVASAPPDGVLDTNGAPTNVVFTSGGNAYGLLSGQYGVTDGQATNYGSFVFAVTPVSRAPRLLAVRKQANDTLELDAWVQQNRSVQVEARFWDVPVWTPVLTNRIPNGDWATNIFWTLTNVPMGFGGIIPPDVETNYGKYLRLKSVAD